MEFEFAGLPLHVLIVHVTVVAVPLVALLLVIVGAWPRARRVLWLPVGLAAVGLVPLVQLTISAGEWLEARVPESPLIQAHTALGDDLTPWAIGLAVVGVAMMAWAIVEAVARRRAGGTVHVGDDSSLPAGRRGVGRAASVAASVVLAIVSLGVGAGATWTLVQIGESGSRAVWDGSFSDEPLD